MVKTAKFMLRRIMVSLTGLEKHKLAKIRGNEARRSRRPD